jgi:hypothetical protein
MDRYVCNGSLLPSSLLIIHHLGQVLGLFVVGLGEYCAVWLGTDWDKEVERAKERNLLEAKTQAFRDVTHELSQDGSV